jgi:hypothetical protein
MIVPPTDVLTRPSRHRTLVFLPSLRLAIPAVKSLMDNAASIASLLGVRLPPINFGALLHRWAIELELPEVGR